MNLFVSYNRANRDQVDPIVDELLRDHEVWTDQQLHAAQTWWKEILDQIQQVDAMILVLSPDYLASEACAIERDFAARCRKPLIQIAVADVPDVVLPEDLAAIQRVASLPELMADLPLLPPAPPLPDPAPVRPDPPRSRFAKLRREICGQQLEAGLQFSIIAEIYLYSRSSDPDERKAGRALLDDIARRNTHLLVAPWRLLEELRRTPETVESTSESSTEVRAALGAERERTRTLDAELSKVRRAVTVAEEERDRASAQAATVLAERDEAVAARDAAAAEREESAARLATAEAERDAAVAGRESVENARVTAIVGAALAGIGLTSLFIVTGVYRIVPKPWDFVVPNVALAGLGAVLCGFALRQHRRSAVIGLVVCVLSVAAAAIDILKVFHKI